MGMDPFMLLPTTKLPLKMFLKNVSPCVPHPKTSQLKHAILSHLNSNSCAHEFHCITPPYPWMPQTKGLVNIKISSTTENQQI